MLRLRGRGGGRRGRTGQREPAALRRTEGGEEGHRGEREEASAAARGGLLGVWDHVSAHFSRDTNNETGRKRLVRLETGVVSPVRCLSEEVLRSFTLPKEGMEEGTATGK